MDCPGIGDRRLHTECGEIDPFLSSVSLPGPRLADDLPDLWL
jgi:hypothetical protein